MARYFKTDSRKLTFGEYWNFTRSWKVLIPWTCKILRIPLPLGGGVPEVTSLRELIVPESELSPNALANLRGPLAECLQLGFHTPWFHKLKESLSPTDLGAIALQHTSGETVAKIMYARQTSGQIAIENLYVAFISAMSDGTIFITTNNKPQLNSAPGYVIERLVGTAVAPVWQRHCQRLDAARVRNPPKAWRTSDEVEAFCDILERAGLKYNIRRGVYAEMTPDEIETVRRSFNRPQTTTGTGTPLSPVPGSPPPLPGAPLPVSHENAAILLELEKLQKPGKSWASAVVVFAISLILFASIGALRWNSEYVLLLLLVLFVHETGHYLAMKLFRYENVKMFFIPLFGAAVTGRHLRAEGWKKAIVSLMGPLPGVALGAGLSVGAILLDSPQLNDAAMLFLVINGFNLLPLVPLDGGWILNAVLFCRNRWLDAAFKVAAGLVLCFLGQRPGGRIFFFLGLMMIFATPHSFRIGKVTARLRNTGFVPDSPDTPGISPSAAETIIQEVKAALPPKVGLNAKSIANMALNVYEQLHSRAPTVWVSLGLLAAYAATIATALIFSGVAMGYRLDGNLGANPSGRVANPLAVRHSNASPNCYRRYGRLVGNPRYGGRFMERMPASPFTSGPDIRPRLQCSARTMPDVPCANQHRFPSANTGRISGRRPC